MMRRWERRLDAMFREAYPADGPGAAVRVQRGDAVLLRQGYGLADVELGVPIEPDMVFRLGSITKQFTATAVMMLAAEGKVDLDAPLSAYLPDYPQPGASASLDQLLHHTAGIPSYTSRPSFWDGVRRDLSVDEMIALWKDDPLDFPPGSHWSYSNSGYFLLGAVIEKVSGLPYADFVQQRIFAPLGLARTTYGDPVRVIPRRVPGYDLRDGAVSNAAYLSMTQPYAAGALLSSVDDLARWGDALFHSDRLLPAAWRDRLLAPATLTDGRRTGYACGLVVQSYDGHAVIAHGGGINGFETWVGWVPDLGIGVAVLSNVTGHQPGPETLGLRALALAMGRPLDRRTEVTPPPGALAEYPGVYEVAEETEGGQPVTRIVRIEDGTLTSQRSGGSRQTLHFAAPDELWFDDSLTAGRFERDADGRVVALWIGPRADAEERAVKTDHPIPQHEAVTLDDLSLLDALVGEYRLAPSFSITRAAPRRRPLRPGHQPAGVPDLPGEREPVVPRSGRRRGGVRRLRGRRGGLAHPAPGRSRDPGAAGGEVGLVYRRRQRGRRTSQAMLEIIG